MDWRRVVRRGVQLYVGLLLYGLSAGLQVRSGLGLDPWDVFHQGLARHVGLAIGTVLIIVGAAVLLLWIPLRQRPGLGTVSNVVLVGLALNWSLDLLPEHAPLGWRVSEMLGGIVLCAVATGMYIGAHLGPGPRDGLMTGLARVTGRSIRLVRTGLELTVLITGWLLGGTVGIGTLLFALSIGPLVQVSLNVFDIRRAGLSELSVPSATLTGDGTEGAVGVTGGSDASSPVVPHVAGTGRGGVLRRRRVGCRERRPGRFGRGRASDGGGEDRQPAERRRTG